MRNRRVLAVGMAALALVASLAACGHSRTARHPTGADAAAGYPVTITSALGRASIPDRPRRVVTLGWGSQDAALALGVVPVGMEDLSADAGRKDGILPWDREALDRLHGTTPTPLKSSGGQVPFEKIAALHPDLILAVYSGITAAQYKQLSAIAPTVGYPGRPWLTSWSDQLSMVGKALGRGEQADRLRRQTDELVARSAREHPEFRGKTIAFGSGTTTDAYNFYYDTDPRMQLLRQLGFTLAPSVTRLGAGASANSFSKQVSLEKLGTIRPQILVAWYLSAGVQKTLEHNALFRTIPAVAHGGYVPLTDPALVFATSAVNVLSLPWMLKRYLALLHTAATKAG